MTDVLERITELERENREYAQQLRRLTKAEHDLMESRLQLNDQLKIYRKLQEAGKKLNATFVIGDIIELVLEFVIYELNFERCVILLCARGESVYRVEGADGYYDDDSLEAVKQVELPASNRILEVLQEARDRYTHLADSREPAARELAKAFQVDEFVILPLRGEGKTTAGLLVTGNRASKFSHQSRVSEDDDKVAMLGLHNLATQVGTALTNATLYRDLELERSQLEQKVEERTLELSTANEELKKLDQLKTQFFSNVSHELRTPLTLSIGPLAMLLEGDDLDPGVARTLTIVHSNQLRLLKLINELLDFAKLEAGRMTSRFSPIDVVMMMRYFVETLEAAADSRDVRLELVAHEPSTELYVDGEKFEKVVMNLLSNAFKFTPDGGTIRVEIEGDDAGVRVHVRDTGIGIPAEAMDQLFDRFSQVDSSEKRHYSGTGIGLAMVKELMQLHGGDVSVDSAVGQGSTFTLHFRRGRDHLDPETVSEERASSVELARQESLIDFVADDIDETGDEEELTPGATEGSAAGDRGLRVEAGGATVLVVDDTPAMRHMIRTALEPSFRVRTAKDGLEGLELARRLSPELIVSDVMMPRMSGIELCQAVKSDPGPLSRTPVILVTARAETTMKLEGLDHGADDYLVKPFNHEELLKRSRNAIVIRRQERLLAKLERQTLERDLEVAGAVQSLLLPEREFSSDAVTLAAHYEPADRAGGDWWWYDAHPDGSFRLLLGDVTGHGAGAAMVTATVAASYRLLKKTGGSRPTLALVRELAASLQDLAGGSYWMTLGVIDVDPRERRITYWSAGAPPVIILREGGRAEVVPVRGLPLGGSKFETNSGELEYRAGDRLFAFTDGLLELPTKTARPLGVRRIRDMYRRTAGSSLGDARSRILEEIEAYRAGPNLEDDVAFVLMEMR